MLSDEQVQFRDTLRRFLAENSPSAEVRRVMETELGHEPKIWEVMTRDLGLPGVAIPEALGGQGFGLEELCVVAAELGRSLTPAPFLGSAVLAGRALAHAAPGGLGERLQRRIAQGETISLALAESSFDLSDLHCHAGGDAEAVTLTGEKRMVLDLMAASQILVVARNEGGLGLYLVDPSAPGLGRRRLRTLDRTRRLGALTLEATPARCLCRDARPALERALLEATVALCAESVGGMEIVLETAVAYARERNQFGRPIGSFQAVKHKLADLWILFEGSRTACREAVVAVAEGNPEAPLLASIAKAYVSDAYKQATFDNIQVHGGVGFTWEYDAHLYLRRAQFAAPFLGDASLHRERIARWLEATAA